MSETKYPTTVCRHCGGDGQKADRNPGDPDARYFACEECDGAGDVVAQCDFCNENASVVMCGANACRSCADGLRDEESDVAPVAVDTATKLLLDDLAELRWFVDGLRAADAPLPPGMTWRGIYRASAAVEAAIKRISSVGGR